MASQFQKQLVGSIILVGISVAVLPSLFDGQKWYNGQSQPAIPLYQSNQAPTEQSSNNLLPANGQSFDLSNELPEHYEVPNPVAEQLNAAVATPQASAPIVENNQTSQIQGLKPLNAPANSTPVATQTAPERQSATAPSNLPKQPTKPAEKLEQTAQRPIEKPVQQAKPVPAETKPQPASGKYAVQLAALSNSARANELVSKLQAAGYPAFTVSGAKLTRVYVGPNESKQNLTQQLGKLKSLTGLDGQVVTLK